MKTENAKDFESVRRNLALKVLVLIVACGYFLYVVYWFAKTVPWIALITQNPAKFMPAAGVNLSNPLGISASYVMEYVGFMGLAVRVIAACFAVAAATLVLKRQTLNSSRLRSVTSNALLFEGAYFFSFVPAFYYLAAVSTLPVTSRACLSGQLGIQLALISPSLIFLSLKIRKPTFSVDQLTKWASLAAVAYLVALWVSYWLKWTEMSALEGLSFLVAFPRVIAFLNTAVVFSLSVAVAMLGTRTLLRKGDKAKIIRFWGVSAILLGVNIAVFVAFCVSVNAAFLGVFGELWIIPLVALGAYMLVVSFKKIRT